MTTKTVLDILSDDPETGFTQLGNNLDSMYAELDLTHRMLLAQNLDATVDRFDRTPRAGGFVEIRNALLQTFLVGLPRIATDSSPTTCSLANLKNALDFVPLYRVCLERFTREPPISFLNTEQFTADQLREMETSYREGRGRKREKEFHERHAAFRASCEHLWASPIVAKIKKARNKVLAHAEFSRPDRNKPPERVALSKIGLKWNDLGDALDALRPVLYDGILLVTNTSYDMKGLDRINSKIANDFWSNGEKP